MSIIFHPCFDCKRLAEPNPTFLGMFLASTEKGNKIKKQKLGRDNRDKDENSLLQAFKGEFQITHIDM